jgi:hypothetical protein
MDGHVESPLIARNTKLVGKPNGILFDTLYQIAFEATSVYDCRGNMGICLLDFLVSELLSSLGIPVRHDEI